MIHREYFFYSPEKNQSFVFVQESKGFFWCNGIEWSEKAWASIGIFKIGYIGKTLK